MTQGLKSIASVTYLFLSEQFPIKFEAVGYKSTYDPKKKSYCAVKKKMSVGGRPIFPGQYTYFPSAGPNTGMGEAPPGN